MKKSRMFSLVATIGATATIFGLTSCGEKTQQMGDMTPEIATITVAEGTSDLASNYAATIKGKTDIDVRPLVSGFITKVHVDEGQHVSKGQTLFTLDQVQYQAAVDQTLAQVNAARTAVESARLTADNKQRLFDKNIISEYENQLAKNQLSQAEAQLSQANAALTTARKNLSYTVVTAPSDGFVGSIPNREGSLASPSMVTPLTTVSDNSDIYAYFSINDERHPQPHQRREEIAQRGHQRAARCATPAGRRHHLPESGKVATVSGVIDSSTGAANVRARFKNINGMLRSGSTGRILIPNRMSNVILVPQRATFEIQDRRFVYVVNDSNKTVATPR